MASQSATQNILKRIISPKIVSSGGGYVAKTDIINVDNLVVNTINGQTPSGGGAVGMDGVFNPTGTVSFDLNAHTLTDSNGTISIGANIDMVDNDIIGATDITFTGILSGPMGPITGGGTGIIAYGTTGCNIAQGPNSSVVDIEGPSGLTNNGIVMIGPITNNYGIYIYSSTQAATGATSSLIRVSAGGMSGLFNESQNPLNFNYAVLKL